MNHKGKGAVICIPTFNEKENLPKIIPAVLAEVPETNILVIDDNSPDGTGKLAEEIAEQDERVHVLHRTGKAGLGKAYLAGFEWAIKKEYDYIVEFDADFSHNPKYLPGVFDALQEVDFVVCSRRVKGGGVENWGPHRRLLSWGGSVYARTILDVPIKDLTGGFNGFRRQTLEIIDYKSISSTGYAFQIEIKFRCCKSGLSYKEIPIIFPDRREGVSKMSSNIMFEAMMQVWKMKFSGFEAKKQD